MNADQRREIEERIEDLVDMANGCDDVDTMTYLMSHADGLVEALCVCGYPCRIVQEDDDGLYFEAEYEEGEEND